ncbi:hypothetical protein BH20VER1_BH20VER1_29550 [soil metagenome]
MTLPISLRLTFISLIFVAPTSPLLGQSGNFSNPSAITINDNAAATPYPSTILVSGFAAGSAVTDVNVTLTGLTHVWPDDVGVLLVDPTGNFKVRLMTDAGGNFPVSNVNVILDSQAPNPLPDNTQIFSGTYRPIQGTPVAPGEEHDANFPAPAPAGPYSNTLNTFNGISPNGTWRLYVDDDTPPDSGAINGGWSLSILVASPPALVGAASRLSHGFAGPFNVAMPLDGSGVEPRSASGNYTAVLSFDRPVQSGSAAVTSGVGSVSSVSFSGNDMLVNLTGVADRQRLTVTATNVAGANGLVLSSASVAMGFLVGDTNNSGGVTASDVAQTKSQSGQTTTAANFRTDVNASGSITASDIAQVKAASGAQLPP